MNVFIVSLKDQPGELARVAEAIAAKGINITAFAGVTCGGDGSIALTTDDEAGTRDAFRAAKLSSREVEAVTATLGHTPGTLAQAARKLAEAGVNIEAALPTTMSGGTVGLAFATDQPARAREVLGQEVMAGVR
jgi:hypothetical protein